MQYVCSNVCRIISSPTQFVKLLSMSSSNLNKIGDQCYDKLDKINGELFTLTYGALIVQLLKDYENQQQVNEKLESMGYNIGVRLIDELLATSGIERCSQGDSFIRS